MFFGDVMNFVSSACSCSSTCLGERTQSRWCIAKAELL